jgi:hypothetical protein
VTWTDFEGFIASFAYFSFFAHTLSILSEREMSYKSEIKRSSFEWDCRVINLIDVSINNMSLCSLLNITVSKQTELYAVSISQKIMNA